MTNRHERRANEVWQRKQEDSAIGPSRTNGLDLISRSQANDALRQQKDELVRKFDEASALIANLNESLAQLNALFRFIDGAVLALNLAESQKNRLTAIRAIVTAGKNDGKDKITEIGGEYSRVLADAKLVADETLEFADRNLQPIVRNYLDALLLVESDNPSLGFDRLLELARIHRATSMIADLGVMIRQAGRHRDPVSILCRDLIEKYERTYGEGNWSKIGHAIKDHLSQQQEQFTEPEKLLWKEIAELRGDLLRRYLKDKTRTSPN